MALAAGRLKPLLSFNRGDIQMNRKPRFLSIVAAILLAATMLIPVESFAQRRGGSFGGRSFGGGFSGGRSSGGSFGRSFSGSGSSTRSGSFTRPGGGSFTRSGTGSFGRSGTSSSSFGRARTFTSTQSRGGSPFQPRASYYGPGFHSYGGGYYYNGYGVRYYGGGYGSYWFHPAWYYWMPFHPAFFYSPPMLVNGYYEPGGFSFIRLLLALAIFGVFFWILARIFSR